MNAATPAPVPLSGTASAGPDPDRAPDRAPGTDDLATIAPAKLPPWRRDAQLAAAASASASASTGAANGPSPTNSPSGSPAGSPEPRLNGNGSGVAVAPAAMDRNVSPGPRGEPAAHLPPMPDAVVAPAAVDDRVVDEDPEDEADFEPSVDHTVTSRTSASPTDPAMRAPVPPRLRVPSLTSSPVTHATAHLSPQSPLSSLSPTTPVSPPAFSTAAATAALMSPPAPPVSATPSPAPSRVGQQLYFQRTTRAGGRAGKYMPAHCLVCDLCVSENTTPGACRAHAQGQSCELAQDRADALVSAGAAINLTTLTPSCRAFLETSRYWTDIVRHATRMAASAGTDAAFSVTLCRKRCYSQWTRRKAIDGVLIKRRPRKKPAAERDPDGDAEDKDDDGEFAPDPMPLRKRPRKSARPDWVAPSMSLPPPPSPSKPARRSTLPPPPARARPIDPAPLMARARTQDRTPPPPPPPPPPAAAAAAAAAARAWPSGSTTRVLERAAAADHDDDDIDVDVEETTPKRIDPPAPAAPLFVSPAMPKDPLFALIAGQMYVARTMMQVETMRARLALRERLHAMGYSKEEVEREVAGLAAAVQAGAGGMGMMGGIGIAMGVGALPGTGELGAGVPRK
ncbi:hypothetical protein GGF31_005043 [Allomyces arbusculus]|nr:hypothetical protein GGF31_005043 [Allomyces arbusculus]